MNLYGLTDKEVEELTDAQREWYECAGSASLPNDICSTKEYKSIKIKAKTPQIKAEYHGDMYKYIKEVFND